MRYSDVEETIRQWASDASLSQRHALARYALTTLTTIPHREKVAAVEFSPAAARVFSLACTEAHLVDAATLDQWLTIIDAGALSDGNMDGDALWALTALEHWRAFLRSGDSPPIVELAVTLLDVIDFHIDGADLDDFLANPRMLAEMKLIERLLTEEPSAQPEQNYAPQ